MPSDVLGGQVPHRYAVGSVAVLALLWLLACVPAHGETYDIVLSHGRVMDPESGLDDIRNVGISGGKIRAIDRSAWLHRPA